MDTKDKAKNTQKISFKISEVLLKRFKEQISNLPISRDLFLNNLIKIECEHLDADLDGKRLSDDARAVIAHELRYIRMRTRQISVVVDTAVAERLNEVVEKHNIVRDSFMNRVLYFLLLTESLRKRLKLPEEIDSIGAHADSNKKNAIQWESIPMSPFKWISQVLADPFRYLRAELSRIDYEESGEKLYLIPMPKDLLGFTCYAEDIYLPGTDTYKRIDKELNNALRDIF